MQLYCYNIIKAIMMISHTASFIFFCYDQSKANIDGYEVKDVNFYAPASAKIFITHEK